MKQQLAYTLYLREAVLATAPGGDPNTDESLPYIPGSLIRGALIARYLENGGDNQSADFVRLFLDGSVRFLNAYPLGEEMPARTLPAPQCWVKEKDSTAPDPIKRRIYDLRHDGAPIPSKGLGGFTYLGMSAETPQRPVVYQQSPTFSTAVHTARNRQRGRAVPNDDNSAVFRYKALAPRQRFAGIILFPDHIEPDPIQKLLTAPLLLGGSTSAGYGLAEIADKQVQPVPDAAQAIPAGTPFTLYFASDAIVPHPETGQNGPYVAEWLTKQWNDMSVDIHEPFTRMAWVGGFNATWGLPLPQSWAIQKGSVYVLQAKKEISAEQVRDLISGGMGQRLAEGFGEVQIEPAWPRELYAPLPQSGAPFSFATTEPDWPDLAQSERDMLARMNRAIASQELDRLLAAAAAKAAKKFRGPLSNSQIARLRLRIRPEVNQPDNKFADFKRYLQGTTQRKSANDQFAKSRIGNTNFRKWMENLVKKPETVWQHLDFHKTPSWTQDPSTNQHSRLILGSDPVVLDANISHIYAARLIEAVCTLIANKKKEGRHA